MHLEMGLVHINNVCFGPRTAIDGHTLFIDRQELVSLLSQEPLFDCIEIELAHPGESCRIIHVLDILEPRYRLNGPNFPGALDALGLVGAGPTRVLKNLCVIETSAEQARGRNIIDMSGPATEYSPFGATHNVVLIPCPAKSADMDEYRLAVKKAGLRAAVYLAAAAKEMVPDKTEIYELPPIAFNQGPKDLPRGIKRNAFAGKPPAERAVDMLLAKIRGEPFKSEIAAPQFQHIKPAPGLRDLSSAVIALVTDGGLVTEGNPERMEPGRPTRFTTIPVDGVDRLDPKQFDVVHSGYDTALANQDPHRLVPLDVMRELERQGIIGKLHEFIHATGGAHAAVENATRIGQSIAERLKSAGVNGGFLTST